MMDKPALWINGQLVEYEVIRTPIYPRSRLKRLWWKLRGIQPTVFHEHVLLKQAPSAGRHTVMHEYKN